MEYVAIAAAAMQAVGAVRQGNAQAAAYNSQAQANEYNATMARNNAQTVSEQANANEETQRRKARIIEGQQRAGIAEAGIGNEGTGSDLVQQSASNAEMDALNIRYQGLLQSTGYQNQAGLDDWQAQQNRKNASTARTSGYINAGAQALSGAGGYMQGQARVNNAGKTTGGGL